MVETLGVSRPTDQCKKKPMGTKKDRAAQIQSASNLSGLRIQAVFMSCPSALSMRASQLVEACLRAGTALHLRAPSDPLRPPQPSQPLSPYRLRDGNQFRTGLRTPTYHCPVPTLSNRVKFNCGRFSVQKQMRLGPATQAALLSRMFPTAVFRQGRKIIAPALRRAAGSDAI